MIKDPSSPKEWDLQTKLKNRKKQKLEKRTNRNPSPTARVWKTLQKLDIRVGKVLLAEPVKRSNKLLRVEVDIGGSGQDSSSQVWHFVLFS